MRQTTAAAIVAAFLALPATAEVRLVGGGLVPELAITPTHHGVWTPTGPVDPFVLNAAGDVLGDGYPGHARRGSAILVAWNRPVSSAVQLRLSGGPRPWHASASVPAPGAFGSPKVVSLPDGWLVAYTIDPEHPTIVLVGVTSDGRPTLPFRLVEGLLVDLVGTDEGIHVLGISFPDAPIGSGRVATLEATTVALGISGPDLPITIGRVSTTAIDRISVPDLPIGSGLTVPVLPIGSGRVGRSVLPSVPITIGHSILPSDPVTIGRGPDIRTHQGHRADGSEFALATWWVTPGELHYVELTAAGPDLPWDRLRSRRPYAQALVEQAVREVRER